MSISVIIPNYNHASFLRERINSVLNQAYQDFELIILDDCSTDNSREIIETYRNHLKVSHIIYNTENSGSTFKQWKKGIELAKAELIWIAESDDYADINFLATLVDKFKDETVSLAYCRTVVVGEDKRQNLYQWGEAMQPETWNSDHTFIGKEFINSFLKYRNVIPNASAVIFKKKYFTDVDDILKMRYAGDWLLWIRLAEKGNIAYSHKTLNYFREHRDSTRAIKYFEEEKRRIEEYFIVINETSSVAAYPFKPFDKAYSWIIDEWLLKMKTFGLKKALRPPYPFLFLLRFYFRLLISKF
ncbi:MAG: glycosyltransferase [Bacteroidota bacterium]|nr:glycosyltransferase [Bacteroidota bacterium]